jgi:NADPH:quinone reductase-like Zn-dependent oxidoreductase
MSIPETFKAAVISDAGAPITIADRSLAPLESGEVAIKITATAINPVDWKMRDWNWITEYPAVLGSDAAGEIAAVGPNVSGFSVGDRVFFQGIVGKYNYSTFQQFAKMPAELLGKTPGSISDDQAAGISLASIGVVTAYYDKTGHGLPAPWDKDGDKVGSGKSIIILGGSSSVGQYAIQYARLSGYDNIITNSSTAHIEYLKGLGAHVVLDRSKQSSLDDFKSAVGDLPLDFVFDTISAKETQVQGVQILQAIHNIDASHVITLLPVEAEAKKLGESQEPKVNIEEIMAVGSLPGLRHISEPLFKHLGGEDGYIAKGAFVPNRPVVIPGGLNGLADALQKSKDGVSGQKIIIRPHDE